MKYFICALTRHTLRGDNSIAGNCLLGIPSESTERILPASGAQADFDETGNEEAFISIPALFKLKDQAAHHRLVLKKKRTLLLPRIDVELEIPEGEIQALPNTLNEMFGYFRGIYFGQNMVLILDPDKLLEHTE